MASWISWKGESDEVWLRLELTLPGPPLGSLITSSVPAGMSMPSSMLLSSMIWRAVVPCWEASELAVAPAPALTSLILLPLIPLPPLPPAASLGSHSLSLSETRARMGLPPLENIR